jgi:hypothetical protein
MINMAFPNAKIIGKDVQRVGAKYQGLSDYVYVDSASTPKDQYGSVDIIQPSSGQVRTKLPGVNSVSDEGNTYAGTATLDILDYRRISIPSEHTNSDISVISELYIEPEILNMQKARDRKVMELLRTAPGVVGDGVTGLDSDFDVLQAAALLDQNGIDDSDRVIVLNSASSAKLLANGAVQKLPGVIATGQIGELWGCKAFKAGNTYTTESVMFHKNGVVIVERPLTPDFGGNSELVQVGKQWYLVSLSHDNDSFKNEIIIKTLYGVALINPLATTKVFKQLV